MKNVLNAYQVMVNQMMMVLKRVGVVAVCEIAVAAVPAVGPVAELAAVPVAVAVELVAADEHCLGNQLIIVAAIVLAIGLN